MIIQYTITNSAWTPVTTAGQSGSCWLDEQGDGAEGHVDVRLWHGTTPPGDTEITKGKVVRRPTGNDDILPFTSDSASDVYYARCANPGDEATLSVDAV